MTTNGSIPAQTVRHAHRASRWLPASGSAWAVLGLSAAATWPVAFILGVNGWMIRPGCFDECGTAADAAPYYLAALLAALTPAAALRLVQSGDEPPSRSPRTVAAAVLVVAVTAVAWTVQFRF